MRATTSGWEIVWPAPIGSGALSHASPASSGGTKRSRGTAHRLEHAPAKPMIVSFDDGYHSHIANAFPVLRALGWPGVLNLELKNIRSDYGLTAPQVRTLIAAGWELDSHTIDHPDLTTLDATALRHELADSRAELKRRFGVPVDFFCYPAGRYDDAAIAAVRAAGYLAATTTQPGLAQPEDADRYTLPRVRVNNGVSGASLVAQLSALN
jgi:peptidoglycan/xylan/chitin deacetylase (PgdA/CDA1 family)